MTWVLGISAFYHDSAAALLRDGEIVAAAQEERFTRKKQDASYPKNAIQACLDISDVELNDIDYIVFYEKPFLKFERLLETYLSFAPRGISSFAAAMPVWLREKLFMKNMLIRQLKAQCPGFEEKGRLRFSEHHLSHAASAFYPSPFDDAVVLTLDGVGESATSSVAIGSGRTLSIKKEMHFPHSLGLFYSAVTYYTGFKINSGEYKVMGLAPYGEPKYRDLLLDNVINVKDDGSIWMDQSYFNYCTGLTMTNDRFADLFGHHVRQPDSESLTQFHMDMARSVQEVTEEVVLKIARHLRQEFDVPNLCMAGGVALNCVVNGKLARAKIFDNLWVQPAAGDAGGALGAALALWHLELKNDRAPSSGQDSMKGGYLGPEFSQEEIEEQLRAAGANFETVEHDDDLYEQVTCHLAEGSAVGWFSGRMEFGPRALGARSILGDPRSPSMQKNLNLKVKYRESFRPFAPSVLDSHAQEWFELDGESPYMLIVADVAEDKRISSEVDPSTLFGLDRLNLQRSLVPAITHVDYSARIQTVHEGTNPRYYGLIRNFYERTGCPMLVNTSFNVRGEPIVQSPSDAYRCFMGTEIEVLVCGRSILRKQDQDPKLKSHYASTIEMD